MFLRQIYHDGLAQASYLIGCQASGEAIVIGRAPKNGGRVDIGRAALTRDIVQPAAIEQALLIQADAERHEGGVGQRRLGSEFLARLANCHRARREDVPGVVCAALVPVRYTTAKTKHHSARRMPLLVLPPRITPDTDALLAAAQAAGWEALLATQRATVIPAAPSTASATAGPTEATAATAAPPTASAGPSGS
jgi:hypothetical protein